MWIGIDGLLAGCAHVLSGPDHLVGVAPLTVERRPRVHPGLVGATWGLGHGLGVALLGVLGQTLLSAADVELASVWAERLVGVVLVVLGWLAVRRARSVVVHEHTHAHDGSEHVHLHMHAEDHGQSGTEARGHGHTHTAFGVGLVHGLAGAGHFWAVLPSLAMERGEAAVYISTYVVGSLILMAVFGAVLGRCARTIGVAWLPRFLQALGVVTIGVGVVWTLTAFGVFE